MTRKDYITIATALRNARANILTPMQANTVEHVIFGVDHAANNVADWLAYDNPRFDREHFLAVVRGDKDINSHPTKVKRAS